MRRALRRMSLWLSFRLRPEFVSAGSDGRILVAHFRGRLGHGSAGNGQVDRMEAELTKAIQTFGPRAVVLDLSPVTYVWGNHVWNTIMRLDSPGFGNAKLPAALVYSASCDQLGTFARRVTKLIVTERVDDAIAAFEPRRALRTRTS